MGGFERDFPEGLRLRERSCRNSRSAVEAALIRALWRRECHLRRRSARTVINSIREKGKGRATDLARHVGAAARLRSLCGFPDPREAATMARPRDEGATLMMIRRAPEWVLLACSAAFAQPPAAGGEPGHYDVLIS